MSMSMECPCIYFEKDGKCRKFSDDTAVSYCVMGPCPEQTLSNAGRIRAMSDKELAEWAINKAPNIGKCYTDSRLGLLDWLQQPAEEDT